MDPKASQITLFEGLKVYFVIPFFITSKTLSTLLGKIVSMKFINSSSIPY
jgi:hypothetical protein